MKTMVLGVGNPILQDDSIGLHIVESLKTKITDLTVVVETAFTGGLNLLDSIQGYEKLIVVDSVKNKSKNTGDVDRFTLQEVTGIYSSNPHDVSFPEAMELARNLGMDDLPSEIIIIGVVVNHDPEFGEELSHTVREAIPKAVSLILCELQQNRRKNT